MYIEKYTNGGSRFFRNELTDADDRVGDWHCGKLAYDCTHYAAYFAIHGTAGWTEGSEGDSLKYVDGWGIEDYRSFKSGKVSNESRQRFAHGAAFVVGMILRFPIAIIR